MSTLDKIPALKREDFFRKKIIILNNEDVGADWYAISSNKGERLDGRWAVALWNKKNGQVGLIYDTKLFIGNKKGILLENAKNEAFILALRH